LVKALSVLNGQHLSPLEVAAVAHHIERNILGFSGGVQDQYISSLGGIQIISVTAAGRVAVEPLAIEVDKIKELERKLVLVYSGIERDSSKIIKSQEADIEEKVRIYDAIKKIAIDSLDLLRRADIAGLGQAMDEHWCLKKQLSKQMSGDSFDQQYENLKKIGSTGGKLVGAGGGGFFMMAVPHHLESYIKKVYELGYHALDWCFDFEGSHIINQVACPLSQDERSNVYEIRV
jgi:D-glycero-alpha-D-manno-heptose-7-phosphate kinase